MECYQHTKKMACGICAECGKGVCKECIIDSQNLLACSVECLRLLIEKKEMNEQAKKLYGIGQYASIKRSNADWISMLLLGVIFTAYGGYITYNSYIYSGNLDIFILALGVVFFVISFLYWKRGKKLGFKV